MTDKEKVAQWMIRSGYATGHGDTVEDLLNELEQQILENWHRAMVNGMEAEREACAKVCDDLAETHEQMNQWGSYKTADALAQAIRARAIRG